MKNHLQAVKLSDVLRFYGEQFSPTPKSFRIVAVDASADSVVYELSIEKRVESDVPATESLGARLRLARKAIGYTQLEMAEAVGLGFRAWSDYEREKSDPCSQAIATLIGIGIDANWLLTGRGTMLLADSGATV